MSSHRFIALFCTATLATHLLAQEPTIATSPSRTVFQNAHGVTHDGDQWLGIGADYKALFRAGAFDYVPVLGERAPRNLPLSLRLTSIVCGNEVVAANAHETPSVSGNVICYRHGDVRERIEVRPEGIELSYQFASRPIGKGDLVVRLGIETGLEMQPSADGLQFSWPTVGGVHIGGVTGIDATGRRCTGSLRCDGKQLELALPDAFVASAVYPVVLDPLISTTFLASSGTNNDTEPVTAYSVTTDRWLVVWRRIVSALNSDIMAQRVVSNGNLFGAPIAVRTGGLAIARAPAVCGCHGRPDLLITWQEGNSPFGPYEINCRTVDSMNGSISSAIQLNTAGESCTEPDAWGGRTNIGFDQIVVWNQGGATITGCVVDLDPLGEPTAGSPINLVSGVDIHSPSLSPNASGESRIALAWATSSDVRAVAISRQLAVLGSSIVIDSGSAVDDLDIDGDGYSFVIAFAADEPGVSTKHDVLCRPLVWNLTTLATAGAAINVAAASGVDEIQPSVGWTGQKAVVLWAVEASTAFNLNVRGVELSALCQPCGRSLALTGGVGGSPTELLPSVATARASGANSDDALIVFAEAEATPTFRTDVVAVRYEGTTGGPITAVGTGCGNSGSIGTNFTAFGPGNVDFRLTLSNAPPTSVPFLLLGLPGGETTCGTCVVTNPLAVVFGLLSGGQASYLYPLPCNTSAFVGFTMSAQWVLLQSGTSPCAQATGVAATRRLHLGFAY